MNLLAFFADETIFVCDKFCFSQRQPIVYNSKERKNINMKKIDTCENKKFKCPICGNDEFVEGAIYEYGEIDSIYIAHSYTCFECGYMFLVNKEYIALKERIGSELAKPFEKLENAIKAFNKDSKPLREDLSKLNERVNTLNEESKDVNRTVKRDGEIKEELKTLENAIRDKESELSALEIEVSNVKHELDKYFKEHSGGDINNLYYSRYQRILSKLKKE